METAHMELDPDYGQRLAELGLQSKIAWIVAAVLLILLLLFMLRAGRRFAFANERTAKHDTLHRCESATASIEFLLVLFPFLFIVMTVWQLAFMFNARLHVAYSAYAAARSASVMVPAEFQAEKEGELKRESEPNASKWRRIARAAIPGTLAISPGDLRSAGGTMAFAIGGGRAPQFNQGTVLAAASRIGLMTAHYFDFGVLRGTRLRRAGFKSWYADNMTQVLVNGQNEKTTQNLVGSDTVTVTVNYVFWLQVPYVGGILEALFKGRVIPGTSTPAFTTPFPSMLMTETVTMPSWRRKRAIEPGG
jgi:hypothetical protein